MNVLQCVCNIEGNFLGLNHGVQIIAAKLDNNDLGAYNESESTIKISTDLVDSGDVMEVLETVCHEMFHAAQWEYVGIYEGLDDSEKSCTFLVPQPLTQKSFIIIKRQNRERMSQLILSILNSCVKSPPEIMPMRQFLITTTG